MSAHDPEGAAAAYLGGALSPAERAGHEQHLLGCEECWREVELGRHGRSLAEESRELAPAGLLERVRASVLEAAASPTRTSGGHPAPGVETRPAPAVAATPRRYRVLALAAATATVVATAALGLGAFGAPGNGRSDNVAVPAVQAAVDDFRAQRLPGDALPTLPVPDLAGVGLLPMGAAAGEMDGEGVTGFAYADATGRRVTVYLSDTPFPRVAQARSLTADADGPWLARTDGVVLLCARLPHAMLLVGEDATLVRAAAEQLDAV